MINAEHFLFIGAILLFVAVMAGKVAYRFNAPALLLFLAVGLFFGYDILSFNSPELTQFIGMLALCIILFSGGMDTKFSEIRPIMAEGITLATAGVLMTALLLGTFVYFVSPLIGVELSFPLSLLLASTISSTDSASVFSILRTRRQGLKENLRPLLELESGSNDPMAYILVILLVRMLGGEGEDISVGSTILMFVVQMAVGAFVGYLFGRLSVWVMNKINIDNVSLYSVLLLACVFFTFSFTSLIKGNGYLAVYIAGLIVGNNKMANKRTVGTFFDGITWLLQIVMFLMLGLLVNLEQTIKPSVLILALMAGTFLTLVARPLATFACLAPFRKLSTKARLYISWVGLRGAVPIIFATYPWVAEIENAELIFNVVFVMTIISLIAQGTTVSSMANVLGLAYAEKESKFGDALQDKMKSAFTEIAVTEQMLSSGNTLNKVALPDNTLVVMVCRDGDYFVPKGGAELHISDKLLILSDRNDELADQYKEYGVEDIISFK
ncbi:MAG: potassium/proton antiporter [Alistipes sp.]|jgi:cell volume regulation protein A|nr:potassium/proton antiporter [Alistipes sp.]